tara:strand:+ start:997 stop:2148 length:1152 start_codon:yes stop_codon:yes gene_type:complete
MKIQLHKPNFDLREIQFLKNCIKTGWVSNQGKYVNLFKKRINQFTNSNYVVPTVNGTSALHISLKLSDVKENDEIIVPTITYIATINPILYLKASPIFLDVSSDLNISVSALKKFIDEETFFKNGCTYNKLSKKKISAIIVTHVFGNAVDIKPILKICKKRKIKIIEDAAESLGTFYKKNYLNNKHTGTLGNFGCLSFNGNKIITTGGGGAVLIKKKRDYEYCNYLSDQAKDNKIFSIHNETGFNYKLSNIQSALGCAQFEKLKKYLTKKEKIHKNYLKLFKNNKNFSILKPNSFYKSNYWLNVLIVKNTKKFPLKKLIKKLIKNNIEVRPIWKLNHTQLPFKKFQKYKIKNANQIISTHLCIPSSPDLTFQDQRTIYKIINA